MTITIESSAFGNDQPIPRKYTGDGEDVSPPLKLAGVPEHARELALICDDPDAPVAEPWVHWVIYQIPPSVREMPEGIPTDPRIEKPFHALQGRNGWSSGRTTGYRGPAPPPRHGVHHYHFKVYALDTVLDLKAGMDKSALMAAIKGHILAHGELTGTYKR